MKILHENIENLIDTLEYANRPLCASCVREAYRAYRGKRTRETLKNLRRWVNWGKVDVLEAMPDLASMNLRFLARR